MPYERVCSGNSKFPIQLNKTFNQICRDPCEKIESMKPV